MKQDLEANIQSICKKLFDLDLTVVLTRPDEQFGDYATNIALQASRHIGKKPAQVAEMLVEELKKFQQVANASVAGPGFINIALNDQALLQASRQTPRQTLQGKIVVAEYS